MVYKLYMRIKSLETFNAKLPLVFLQQIREKRKRVHSNTDKIKNDVDRGCAEEENKKTKK